MAPSIQVASRAANVCSRCRLHKQRCDRALPRCSRCALILRHCEYNHSWKGHDRLQNVCRVEPLVIQEPCGFSDLSARGENEFLQLLANCAGDTATNLHRFAQLTSDVLKESRIEVSGLIDRFSSSIHRWFPVVDLGQLRKDAQALQGPRVEDAKTPLLLLVLLLFESLQSSNLEVSLRSEKLYATSKKLMLALVSSSEKTSARLVEVLALIGLYECSQGMVCQAHLTLSSVFTMVTLSESYAHETEIPLQTKVSLLMLDRVIMLSNPDNSIPLLCNPNSTFTKAIELRIRRHFVGESASFGASPSQQLYTMAQIALSSGRVLHHIYCSNHGYELDESYDSVEDGMQTLVAALMAAKDSHSAHLCDSISLALCSLIVLQHSHATAVSLIPDSLDDLKLQTCSQMIWDTAGISFYAIRNIDISQVSLIGMFCQLGAIHTATVIFNNDIPHEGIEDMLFAMEVFFQKWTIGASLLKNVQSVLSRKSPTAISSMS
ncbi:hypothetical protein V8C35DRAFT_302833 [Trichoderma chlorosporum]